MAPLNRREALARLAALVALPLPVRLPGAADDPLDGTVAAYQAGRRRGAWSAAEVTARALARCRAEGRAWRAIDALAEESALAEARAADRRLREVYAEAGAPGAHTGREHPGPHHFAPAMQDEATAWLRDRLAP